MAEVRSILSRSRLPGSLLERLGHLGLWAGLFVTGAYVCFWQLSAASGAGSWPRAAAVLSVLLSATAVYAMDRVKLFDTWLDPADPIAQPRRYHFLLKHTASVRAMAVVLLVLAMTLAYLASPIMPALAALSILGVVLYAPSGREKRRRIKDLLGVKNLYVAGSVVGLALVATALVGPLSHAHGQQFWDVLHHRLVPLTLAAIILLARVALDAALCDLDDIEADRHSGTRTLANTLGHGPTFNLAILGRIALALVILALPAPDRFTRLAWCAAGIVGAIGLVPVRRRAVRDLVDVSLMIEALAATAMIAVLSLIWPS